MAENDQSTQDGNDNTENSESGFFGSEGPFATLLRHIDPRMMAQQSIELSKTMLDIVTGKSEIAPDARDWRFKDEAWTKNPAYKRLAQAYLAATESVEKMIPDDLSVENRQRAELAASIVTSAFAPTNTLIGNPAALAKTIETGGANLTKGLAAFLSDIQFLILLDDAIGVRQHLVRDDLVVLDPRFLVHERADDLANRVAESVTQRLVARRSRPLGLHDCVLAIGFRGAEVGLRRLRLGFLGVIDLAFTRRGSLFLLRRRGLGATAKEDGEGGYEQKREEASATRRHRQFLAGGSDCVRLT